MTFRRQVDGRRSEDALVVGLTARFPLFAGAFSAHPLVPLWALADQFAVPPTGTAWSGTPYTAILMLQLDQCPGLASRRS